MKMIRREDGGLQQYRTKKRRERECEFMSVENNELIWAVEYLMKSPYVRKVKGVTVHDGDRSSKILRLQGALDRETAREICESSHMLGSIRKDLERAKNIIVEAGRESQERVICEFEKYQERAVASAKQKMEAAQKALDEFPVDEEFVAECREKKEAIIREKKKIKDEIGEEVEREYKKEIGFSKKFTVVLAVLMVVSAVWLFYVNPEGEGSATMLFLCVLGGLAGLIGTILGGMSIILLYFRHRKYYSNGEYDRQINEAMTKVNKSIDHELSAIERDIKRGYARGSTLELKKSNCQIDLDLAKSQLEAELQKTAEFQDVAKDPLCKGIALLEETMDNLESLSSWATNFTYEKKLSQHHSMMESIEREKLRAQEASNRVQEEEKRKQRELLQQQARAAEAQAKAAEKQARDIEEIKRRMQNERYGDIQRRYSGEKFPWEES